MFVRQKWKKKKTNDDQSKCPSYNLSFCYCCCCPYFILIQFFNKSDPILLYVQTKNEGKNTPGKRPYKQIIIVSIYPTHHLEYGLRTMVSSIYTITFNFTSNSNFQKYKSTKLNLKLCTLKICL
jgi:hypothetical protein